MSPGLGPFLGLVAASLLIAIVVGLVIGRAAPASARISAMLDSVWLTIPIVGIVLVIEMVVPSAWLIPAVVAAVSVWSVPPISRAAATANALTGVRARAAAAFALSASQRRELNRTRWLPSLRRGLAEAGRRVVAGMTVAGVVGVPGLGRDVVQAISQADYRNALVATAWLIGIAVVLELLWFTWRSKEAN